MTGDGKILKLACLAGLFVGMAALVYGIVLVVGNVVDIDSWVTTVEGLAAAVLGAQNARLANVPSNSSKIRSLALAGALCATLVAVFVLYLGPQTTIGQDVLAVCVAACLLVAAIYAHRIVKDLLRK